MTALMYAMGDENEEIIGKLLECGANSNLQNGVCTVMTDNATKLLRYI